MTDSSLNTCEDGMLSNEMCNCGSSVLPPNLGACVNSIPIPICPTHTVTPYNCLCGSTVLNKGDECMEPNNLPQCPDSEPFNGALCNCGEGIMSGGLYICINHTILSACPYDTQSSFDC